MLIKPNGEELSKKVKNSYELVTVISKRARQLTKRSRAHDKIKIKL